MDKKVNSKVGSFTNGRNYALDQAETEFSTIDSSSLTPDMEKLVFAQAIDFIYHNQFNIIITLLLMLPSGSLLLENVRLKSVASENMLLWFC